MGRNRSGLSDRRCVVCGRRLDADYRIVGIYIGNYPDYPPTSVYSHVGCMDFIDDLESIVNEQTNPAVPDRTN